MTPEKINLYGNYRYETKQFDNGFCGVIDTRGIAPQPIKLGLSQEQADRLAQELNLNNKPMLSPTKIR